MRTTYKMPSFSTIKKKEEKSLHDKEHKYWNRRSFLQTLGLVGGGSMILGGAPITASRPSPLSMALQNAENEDRVLVLIRLKGGNDGLNTVVPLYDYDTYASQRPSIRIPQNNLFNLSSDFGMPNYMNALQSLWGDGKLKVVHGVGYNNQDLSHFRSADIWASAEDEEYKDTGVLGRYFENTYPDFLTNLPEIPPAIQIGSIGNLIFDGSDTNYAFSVSNPDQLEKIAENGSLHSLKDLPGCTYGDQLRFMRSVANTTFTFAEVINKAYKNSGNSVDYGEADLAKQLAIISRMIKGNLGTKIYLVTIDGFDTHADQKNDHQTLVTDLADSVATFYKDLANAGLEDKVLSMTFSEFGRRIFENGSQGTDHGAAAPALLFGPALGDNGFIGNHPDLSDPEGPGNLKASVDFRQLYATVLKDWLCIEDSLVDAVLLEGTYESLSLGFNCTRTLTTQEIPLHVSSFSHITTYQFDKTYLEITTKNTAHCEITLFDVTGRELGILHNGLLTPGTLKIDVKNTVKTPLITGHYIYRIVTNNQQYSKTISIR